MENWNLDPFQWAVFLLNWRRLVLVSMLFFPLGMHLSVSFLKKGGVVSWEVVPKLKKDCPGWFVITFCHGFLTIWRVLLELVPKNSESKESKGHENVECSYVKPTLPARDLWKVSFPLWHCSSVILLVGPTLLWKGREIYLNLYSNKFCRLEFENENGGDMGTHSCFIWVVCVWSIMGISYYSW